MRVCGNYAEIRFLAGQHITPRQAVDSVDWGELIDFTLFKTKHSVAAKSENFSTSGDRGEILRFRFI